jgi:repressor LexA
MSTTLTPSQARVLACVRTFMSEHQRPPTRQEICDTLGYRSPNAAEEHLRALARKGVIFMTPGKARGIELA